MRVFDHPNIADTDDHPHSALSDRRVARGAAVRDRGVRRRRRRAVLRRWHSSVARAAAKAGRARAAPVDDAGARRAGDAGRLPMADAGRPGSRSATARSTGQHWMLTPWTIVEVVHAVQRPLLAPASSTTLAIVEREPGADLARAVRVRDVQHRQHGSPRSVRRVARADRRSGAEEQTAPVDRQRRDVAFQVKITAPHDYADGTTDVVAGGSPEHSSSAPRPDRHQHWRSTSALPMKAHEFHDTRYRRIEYWFDATTRFREFLPVELLTTLEDGERVPTDEHIKVTGRALRSRGFRTPRRRRRPRCCMWCRRSGGRAKSTSTAFCPAGGAAADCASISIAAGTPRATARCWRGAAAEGVRRRSGRAPAGAPYKKYVTQWGNDPIWDFRVRAGPRADARALPAGAHGAGSDRRLAAARRAAGESGSAPGPFQVTALQPPSPVCSAVVRSTSRRTTCSTTRRGSCGTATSRSTAGASYFRSFAWRWRAISPISSPGAHLSNVVLSDIIALTADRWLNVTPAPERSAVRGGAVRVGYDESSGHREVEGDRQREGRSDDGPHRNGRAGVTLRSGRSSRLAGAPGSSMGRRLRLGACGKCAGHTARAASATQGIKAVTAQSLFGDLPRPQSISLTSTLVSNSQQAALTQTNIADRCRSGTRSGKAMSGCPTTAHDIDWWSPSTRKPGRRRPTLRRDADTERQAIVFVEHMELVDTKAHNKSPALSSRVDGAPGGRIVGRTRIRTLWRAPIASGAVRTSSAST